MRWKMIIIDFFHNSMRFPKMAYIKEKNIFYHTTLTSEYDPNLPKIAILITDEPVVSDLYKYLLTWYAQHAYKKVPGYNEKKQLRRIVGSRADFENVNFAKCFMSPLEGKNVVFRCSDLGPTYLVCHFYKTVSVINFLRY